MKKMVIMTETATPSEVIVITFTAEGTVNPAMSKVLIKRTYTSDEADDRELAERYFEYLMRLVLDKALYSDSEADEYVKSNLERSLDDGHWEFGKYKIFIDSYMVEKHL